MSEESFENGAIVPSIGFDHASLDSPEDIMREKLEMGFTALEIVEEYNSKIKRENVESVVVRAEQQALDFIRQFLALVAVEKKPLYFLDQLVWLSGLAASNNLTLPELAKRHGVSKQAFEQAADRTNQYFKFPKTSAQRTPEAREHMREAYELQP